MLTLDPEIEITLQTLAKQEQITPNEFIKRFINQYINQQQSKEQQAKQNLFTLMAKVPSSVSLVNELIQERRFEAKKEQDIYP